MDNNKITTLIFGRHQPVFDHLSSSMDPSKSEIRVLVAGQGPALFELLMAEHPDVIMIDMAAVGEEGLEVCRIIKNNDLLKAIPLIFLTDQTTKAASKTAALMAGGDVLLPNTVDEIELGAQILAMIRIKEANLAKKLEKAELIQLVEKRTRELDNNRIAILNLLEDLKTENEARRNSELSIRESEEKYRMLYESIPIGIGLADLDGRIMDANPAMLELTGYNLEEMRGINVADTYMDPADRTSVKDRLDKNGKLMAWECKLKKKNGTAFDGLINVERILRDGKAILLTTIRDITSWKHGEMIQKIQYNIADAVVSIKYLGELFEIVRNELSKIIDTKNFYIAFYDDKKELLYAPFEIDEKEVIPEPWSPQKSLTGKVIYENRSILLTRTDIQKLAEVGQIDYIGTPAEVWLGVPLTLGEKVIGAIVVQSYDNPDAYDEKSRETLEIIANQLSIYIEQKRGQDETMKLTKGIEQSPVSIVITDPSGTIEYVNPKFTEITGFTQEEAIGQNPRILKSDVHDENFYQSLWQTIIAGNNWKGELRNKKKNGELYWENAIISPIVNDKGIITHFLAIKEDITEKKAMTEELIKAKEKAVESEKLKSSFLANMSHELRTPMTGILGFSEILVENSSTEDQRRIASYIHDSGNRLLETLNLILDLSKFEAEQTDIPYAPVNMVALVKKAMKNYLPTVQKKKIFLRFECAFPDLFINSNDRILSSILHNLINNAIKFTIAGGITLTLTKENENGSSRITIKVADTGIGIPKEHHEMIFEEFRQVSEGHSRHFEGSGLGLSITRKFVQKLNGTIQIESTLGVGSTFIIRLPVTTIPETESREETSGELQPDVLPEETPVLETKRILVVEDEKVNQEFLSVVLRNDYTIDLADTGEDAIRMSAEENYDLIILDISLGTGMDGVEVLHQIRALEKNKETPVIAMTAYAMKGDKEKFIDLGFDSYLSKPFSRKEILSLLKNIN